MASGEIGLLGAPTSRFLAAHVLLWRRPSSRRRASRAVPSSSLSGRGVLRTTRDSSSGSTMGAFCLDRWRCPALQTRETFYRKATEKTRQDEPFPHPVAVWWKQVEGLRILHVTRARTIRPEAEKPPPASTLSPFVGPQVAHRRWRMRSAAAFQKSLAAFAMLGSSSRMSPMSAAAASALAASAEFRPTPHQRGTTRRRRSSASLSLPWRYPIRRLRQRR